jgi:hypothetical protein
MFIGDAPDSTPKLARTFNQTGSTSPKWTFATWYKKSGITTSGKVIYYFEPKTVGAAATVDFQFTNDAQAYFNWSAWSGSSQPYTWQSGGTYAHMTRDFSAWYHICHVVDHSTSPYVWVYINGVLIDPAMWGTKTGAGYAANYSPVSGDVFKIGSNNSNQLGNGYFADTYWIEQQALNPVGTFGEIDANTGQFVPIEYTGTYSGNSFYLDYADSADFGTDQSGLGNNFTATSIPATQQKIDTPTNNYCVMNPADPYNNGITTGTYQNGNTTVSSPGGSYTATNVGTFGVTSGKWYFEICGVNSDNSWMFGVADIHKGVSRGYTGTAGDGYFYYPTGETYTGSTAASYGSTWTYGDVIGVALDMDNGAVYFAKNNTWQNSGVPTSGASKTGAAFTTLTGKTITPCMGRGSYNNTSTATFNLGQDSSFAGAKTAQGNGGTGEDFYYTPPAGFKALNTDNLADPSIALPTDHFNSILWTGDETSPKSFTGVGFSPDLVWTKNRTVGVSHMLYDTVRGTGATKSLESNTYIAEGGGNASTYGYLSAFGSDGFTTTAGSGSPNYYFNQNNQTFVAWNWKAGGTAVSNTDGTITSSVSANPTAGFSIASYTGNGTAGATVGHGLSSAPELIILKSRSQGSSSAGSGWVVYSAPVGNTKYMYLNEANAVAIDSGRFNNTTPTASVFSLGDDGVVNNTSQTFISYCFHSVDGYSKVGSYTGNASSNGPFIYTGFRPSFILVKSTASAYWWIIDSDRDTYNSAIHLLYPNGTNTEAVANYTPLDILSNGWKSRIPAGNGNQATFNTNGQTYIYLAIAKSPLKTANAR